MDTRAKLFTLLAALLVARLALSGLIPLTVDESYAIAASRWHSLSYFDHPPLGFALGRMMADLFGTESRIIVRMPYVILGTLSAVLLFDITRRVYGEIAGFWAAAWYSIAPFFFIAAGHFVLPDGPLNFGLLLCVWALTPDVFLEDGEIALWRWLLAGAALGLALLSKYQAVLFAAAAFVFLVTTPAGRKNLARLGPWAAIALASLGAVPILVWNAEHHWASFAFQSGRALTDGGRLFHPGNLIVTLAGQAAYVWPTTWLAAMFMLWRSLRRAAGPADRFFGLLAFLPIAFFDIVALFTRNSLPHWPMSGFLFAFPLVGKWSAMRFQANRRRLHVDFGVAATLVSVLAVAFVIQLHTAMFTRPFFKRSPTFDMDWQSLDWTAVRQAVPADAFSGKAFVVAPDWAQAAKIAVALGPKVPMEVLPRDPRHFQFIHDPRLVGLCCGVFVGVTPLDRRDKKEAFYRAALTDAHFVLGASHWAVQKIDGYPVFALFIVEVEKR